ncbi:hypothetical protein [Frigidibacter oleivorans]|uniref:hypothetical protein n=1 Tax=Frigidibacter oleivorans TaxID=2487129 RepID=UPI000F8E93ED|nr:hypothetical protein [Frigidibacter oleivorans]
MSNSDSFIDEVTDEVRRDRLFAFLRRWGWAFVVLVLLIVGGAAWTEWSRARDRAEARAFGDALLAAMQADTAEARAAALAALPAEDGRATAIRGMLEAASQLEAGRRAEALAALDAIAADADLPPAWRQLALIKRVIADPDMAASDRGAALDQLAQPGAPYRPLALEQQALDLVAAGERDAAVERLRALLDEQGVPAGLRRRATQLMVALGAQPEAA